MLKATLALASRSPRRRELLERLGLAPLVVDSVANEATGGMPLSLIPRELATRKAKGAIIPGDVEPNECIILGADTLVTLGERILHKPNNQEEAYEHLSTLSGRTHQVTTGVCLLYQSQTVVFEETTLVTFAPLSKALIERYIESGSPFDKAGWYGIQDEFGLEAVSRIEGSYTNVLGLPTQPLMAHLSAWLNPTQR